MVVAEKEDLCWKVVVVVVGLMNAVRCVVEVRLMRGENRLVVAGIRVKSCLLPRTRNADMRLFISEGRRERRDVRYVMWMAKAGLQVAGKCYHWLTQRPSLIN